MTIVYMVRMVSACELTKELPVSVKWEIDVDEDDKDFLCHTLFLKQVVWAEIYTMISDKKTFISR